MGSYFITNDKNAISPVVSLMAKKGLTRFDEIPIGNVTVLNFHKRFVEKYKNVYRHDDDFIIGWGTYFYKNKFASDALKEIFDDLKAAKSPWANITGHFSFAAYMNGELTLITDKCGMYHGYEAQTDNRFYVSNSLFAVAGALPRLTVSKQECIEFLYTQATYGGRTIFSQISHLDAGAVYNLAPFNKHNQYYTPLQESVSIEQYIDESETYFKGWDHPDFSFNCDLSGGYDSRTVAALLENANQSVEYNTNTNLKDPDDHKVAMELADAIDRKIQVFEREDAGPLREMVETCFFELELCRDIFAAAYSPFVFAQKANAFNVIIGGYGGELLRDKYSRFLSVGEMVKTSYVDAGIKLGGEQKSKYLSTLEDKFIRSISGLNLESMQSKVEAIYYLEKMRYWGGSRITAFNQYCFRVHPLLDDALAKYTFGFSLAAKEKATLQRQIITEGSETLAKVRSSYFDKPLYLKDGDEGLKAVTKAQLRLKKVSYTLNKLAKSLGNASFFASSLSQDFVSVFPSKGYLEKLLNVQFDAVFNMKMRGRYLTLEKTLHQYRDKIANL